MNRTEKGKPRKKMFVIICIIVFACILYKAADFILNLHYKTELGDTVIIHEKFEHSGMKFWVTLNGKELYGFQWPDGVGKTQEDFEIYFGPMVQPIYNEKKIVLYRIWDRFTDPLGEPDPCGIVYAYSSNGQNFYNYFKDLTSDNFFANIRLNILFKSVSQKEIEDMIAKQLDEDLLFKEKIEQYYDRLAPNPWTGEPIRD